MGGFVRASPEGQNVRDAVLRGSAAAAMVVARVGCAPPCQRRQNSTIFSAHDGPTRPERT
jgi:5-dehydro-2-deoxygluconokinase